MTHTTLQIDIPEPRPVLDLETWLVENKIRVVVEQAKGQLWRASIMVDGVPLNVSFYPKTRKPTKDEVLHHLKDTLNNTTSFKEMFR